MQLLRAPTRHLFFTGKGGVGKTSLSTASALALADAVILVTRPDKGAIAALQDDLRRAGIEPCAWVLNKSVLAAGTRDPLLLARLSAERKQVDRLSSGLARRLCALPWLASPPIGLDALSRIVSASSADIEPSGS